MMTCAYCGKNPAIKNSHILPRWTIRSALDRSVTGKLRPTDNINKRVQDAEKCPLICLDCENAFSQLESAAAKAFKAGAITYGASYDADFVRFLVSILWRVGVVRADEVQQRSPRFASALTAAVKNWKEYLDGQSAGLGAYPVWFTLLGPDVAHKVHTLMQDAALGGKGAAPIINRYFANWLGCEVVTYETNGFAIVWAKTGSWLIGGVVTVPDRKDSSSVQLSPGGGAFPSAGHAIPPILLATMGHQSWECLKVAREISPIQRRKIEADFKKQSARVAVSSQNQALQEDIKLFGEDAWVELPAPERD